MAMPGATCFPPLSKQWFIAICRQTRWQLVQFSAFHGAAMFGHTHRWSGAFKLRAARGLHDFCFLGPSPNPASPIMKTPRFLFTVILLFLGFTLHAVETPKLETLLAEYNKARTDVLAKLNESYAAQADELVKRFQAASNLDGTDRAKTFARHLRDGDQNNEVVDPLPGTNASDPLAVLEANYAQSRAENLKNVYVFYATAAANLRKELLKENNKAGAEVLTTFLEKIKATVATPTPAAAPKKKKKG